MCKTHRSILNCRVRHCNNIIKDLKSQINQIQDKLKGITSKTEFNNITKQITKTKERVFNTTKTRQIKKFNFLKKTPAYRNTPVPDIIRKKWVINLSSKPLTDGEQSLLQKGPKFAVSSSRVPLTEYIAVTKESVMSLVRTLLVRTVQRSTKKLKRSCTATKRRNPSLKTSPKRRGRPSKPSGKMPLEWS